MNILLNGVGRIGKAILRISLDNPNINIVAINEINKNIQNIAYVINYDSTYGKLKDKFIVDNNYIQNNTTKIEILNYNLLQNINFKDKNIDIIIDSSGIKVDTKILKNLAIKHIFLTHPRSEADINIILGVNENKLDLNNHKIISTSSCNATALAPLLKIIDDNFKIQFGDITTIHPLLNHQKTLDGNCINKSDRDVTCNFEFGRSGTQNIIPSGTTTVEACSYVLKNINENILSSSSFRVPTATVGAINITLSLKTTTTKEEILELLTSYESNQKFKIVHNNYEALVSSDFEQENFTTIIDHRFTQVIQNQMVKFVLWYDNEWGYASKVVNIVDLVMTH